MEHTGLIIFCYLQYYLFDFLGYIGKTNIGSIGCSRVQVVLYYNAVLVFPIFDSNN